MKDAFIKKTTGMIGATIDELSADYFKLGVQLRTQIAKYLIAKGGPWAALGFSFSEKDKGIKLMLASFKSMDGLFKRYSYFIIRNKEEARKIVAIINESFGL